MLRIKEAIVVEGRYDKNTLSQLVDTIILETNGFGIFKNKEQLALLRRLAAKHGLIIFTDGDGAGFVIRNFLKGAIPKEQVKHAYIPDIYGKERRKHTQSAEGKLGVEGMTPAVLETALRRAGATILSGTTIKQKNSSLSKADLFSCGLTGQTGSAEKRKRFLQKIGLPVHMTPNALLSVLSALYTREELCAMLATLEQES